jgi:hypothetical protein
MMRQGGASDAEIDRYLDGQFNIKPAQCTRCRDGGLLRARHLDPRLSSYTVLFRCACDAGRAKRGNYPEWDYRSEARFEVMG